MLAADELSDMTASNLATLVRRRELSPMELLETTITRIEARNPSLNALVHVDFDDARRIAQKAEEAVMRKDELGLLHGVPGAIKDLFGTRPGWPATFGGITALRAHRAPGRRIFTERVERAGAILVGTTNSPVMGFRGTCDNPLFGP